jgi:hypothetical protein
MQLEQREGTRPKMVNCLCALVRTGHEIFPRPAGYLLFKDLIREAGRFAK